MKDFMNFESLHEIVKNLYLEVVDDYGYDRSQCEDFVDESAFNTALRLLEDMKVYCHRKDTHMCGNFCNIRQDWELCPEFIGSEVQPWGRFDDLVKSLDDETISDEDLAKWHQWAEDWFFCAFGTFGLKYNFGESLSCFMGEMEVAA